MDARSQQGRQSRRGFLAAALRLAALAAVGGAAGLLAERSLAGSAAQVELCRRCPYLAECAAHVAAEARRSPRASGDRSR